MRTLESIKKLYKDESGDIVQTSVIIGILVVLAVGALTLLRQPITSLFQRLTTNINQIR